jgi:hypothetical protein
MIRALLIGREPGTELGFQYVREMPYDAVVIGSLTISQLLRFQEESVLTALAEGKRCICIHRDCRRHRKTGLWQAVSPLPSGS